MSFKLLETKKRYEYTDKLQIKVLDLTQIGLATKEDKAYNIDKWARLFKAQTWEEIKMLAVKDKSINEAAATIYQISEDERIRQQCEAREDYLRRQRGIQRRLDKLGDLEKAIAEKEEKLAEIEKDLAEKDAMIAQSKEQLAQSKEQLAQSKEEIAQKDARIAELEALLKKNGQE